MPKLPEGRYDKRLQRLKKDNTILPDNKTLILSYLEDCKRGLNRKIVGIGRRYKYASLLPIMSGIFNKPFTDVNDEDLGKFIDNERVTIDYRKVLKTFAKWLRKSGHSFPDVSEMDCTEKIKDIPALTKNEIERMAEGSKLRDKAIIMFLFDSGLRIGEFEQIKHEDLTEVENPDGRGSYFKIRCKHEYSKTKGRTIAIPMATPSLKIYLDSLKDKSPEKLVFDYSYNTIKAMLKRKGQDILNKRVYPHLLRHSSATYYIMHTNNQGSFYHRYGWTINSNEPQRYIDRAGLSGDNEKIAQSVQNETYTDVMKQNKYLQERLAMVTDDMQRLSQKVEEISAKSILKSQE